LIQLRKMGSKGVYAWLYRYDREWLLAHSPSRNRKKQSRVQKSTAWREKQQQEDACNRDALIVENIRNAADRLMHASGAPKRVSIGRICREVPQLRKRPPSNESTLISQTLHEVAETFEVFAIRRIKYILQKYKYEQIIPPRNKFIRRAKLSEEILQKSLVQQALDEALFLCHSWDS
jgi:Tn7-like transposition protein D